MEPELICIDSSVLITYYRTKGKEQSFLYELVSKGYGLGIPSIVVYEVLRGDKAKDKYWIEFFSKPTVTILDFNFQTAQIAADLYLRLKSTGKLPGHQDLTIDDLLISACAIQHKIKMATLNKKHFENIIELSLV